MRLFCYNMKSVQHANWRTVFYESRSLGSSEMRVGIVFIANDVIVAMATSYRYDVISRIRLSNTEFYRIARLVSDKVQY